MSLISPQSEIHFNVNLFYSAFTLLTYIFIGLSYKNEKYLRYLRILFILFILRQIIRCFDIEETKEDLGDQNWSMLITVQNMAATFFLVTF